jgi:hypothetical protein
MSNDNIFKIPFASTLEEAKALLIKEVKSAITLVDNKVILGVTYSGITLSLHNKNKRPTVYYVEINIDHYGKADSLTIDTIICEVKEHSMLKNTFAHSQAGHVVNLLKQLSEQDCDGNKQDTLKQYEPIGLLYRKASTDEPA